jgi:hypothetical protein
MMGDGVGGMNEKPRATVREIDGQLVLDDPDAVAVATAVALYNCTAVFDANAERVEHFAKRIEEKGLTSADVVIVILNVDTNGAVLAEGLMPGHNWQEYRDRGEIPFARGLAGREGIQGVLEVLHPESAKELAMIEGVAAVVVDYGVAAVFKV